VGEERIPPREAEELAACFGAYARDLFGYACVLVREDGERAEDLVQAVFEAASRHWHRLSRLVEEQRHSWLRATLANIAIAWFRGEYGEHDEHGEHVEAAFRAWLPAERSKPTRPSRPSPRSRWSDAGRPSRACRNRSTRSRCCTGCRT
jgi:DNA-directed RNA polymerase specialized sigma24 family protein